MSKIKLSCDDGCRSDIRLSSLCDSYGIGLTLYLPAEWHSLAYTKGYKPLSYQEALKLSSRDTIGSHTITHRHLTSLSIEEAEYEISESREIINQLFNQDTRLFASPRGYSNPQIDEIILKYYDLHRKTKQPGLVHIHPNSGANDNKPWRECITEETEELFTHSWEIDKYNMWEEIEEWLKSIS